MARKAKLVTLDFLKEKLKYLLEEEDDNGDEFPYNLPKKMEKDLSKIKFDFENYEYGEYGYMNYPCGYEVLENGLPVLFVNAGGDWETPICFIIYWDGSDLRAYIPNNGNVYNRKEKCAYGSENDPEAYEEEMEEAEEKGCNADEIRKDIINRIEII